MFLRVYLDRPDGVKRLGKWEKGREKKIEIGVCSREILTGVGMTIATWEPAKLSLFSLSCWRDGRNNSLRHV